MLNSRIIVLLAMINVKNDIINKTCPSSSNPVCVGPRKYPTKKETISLVISSFLHLVSGAVIKSMCHFKDRDILSSQRITSHVN